MLALWLATGVIAAQQTAPAIYGGDDAPGAGYLRKPRPVIYVWPERKEEAIEAISAVEDETEPTNTAPQSEAIADLREAIETDATAAIIRARLAAAEAAMASIDAAIASAHRAALIEDMRQAALMAALARDQFEMEVAIALCLLV